MRLATAFLVLLFGCATATVEGDGPTASTDGSSAPDRFVIYGFSFKSTDDADDDFEETAAGLREVVANRVVERLIEGGLNAERARGPSRPEGDVLTVSGSFVEIDVGSGARRALVGFGLGASELRTHVVVQRLDGSEGGGTHELGEFDVFAKGNKAPGLMTMFGYGPDVPVVDDALRTGDAVADALLDWIEDSEWGPQGS